MTGSSGDWSRTGRQTTNQKPVFPHRVIGSQYEDSGSGAKNTKLCFSPITSAREDGQRAGQGTRRDCRRAPRGPSVHLVFSLLLGPLKDGEPSGCLCGVPGPPSLADYYTWLSPWSLSPTLLRDRFHLVLKALLDHRITTASRDQSDSTLDSLVLKHSSFFFSCRETKKLILFHNFCVLFNSQY